MAAAAAGTIGSALSSVLRGLGASAARAGAVGKATDSGFKATNEVAFAEQGIKSIMGTIGHLGSTALAAVNPLSAVAPVLAGISGAVGKIAGAGSPLTPLNESFAVLIGSVKGAIEHVSGLGKALSEFVQYANPAHVQVFEFAFRDLMASFGYVFIPALQFATAATRGFADVVYRLAGPFQKLFSAFFDPLSAAIPPLVNAITPVLDVIGSMVDIFADLLRPAMEMLVPIMENLALGLASVTAVVGAPAIVTALTAVLTVLVGTLVTITIVCGPVIAALAAVGWAFKKTFGFIMDALGLTGRAAGGSVNAAVTNAKTGGVESFAEEHWKNAFMSGNGPTVAEEQKNILNDILKLLREWYDSIPSKKEVAAGAETGAKWAAAAVIPGGLPALLLARELEGSRLDPRGGWLDPRTW